MSSQIKNIQSNGDFPWLMMILMSAVTFVGILSELMPSGVMPLMMDELVLSEVQVGNLVGYYAVASAVFAIPLIALTVQFNRKHLLIILLIGFAVSNMVAGLVHNYNLLIVMRVIGGLCAGIMWPMIAAYGMRLTDQAQHGKAIAVIMAGNTLGISLGMPIMTTLGYDFGWRAEFIGLGGFILLIAFISLYVLPSTPGEKLSKNTSPLALLKLPAVIIVLMLTLLGVMAHYGVYVYITSLVNDISLSGGIEMALFIFGVGSLLSVLLAIRYTDHYLRGLTIAMFTLLMVSMLILRLFGKIPGIAHMAFFLWGLSFGPLVTLLQTAVSRQVSRAKDVVTSIQSSLFNLAIMMASSAGGLWLAVYSPLSLVNWAVALAITGVIISVLAKKSLA